MLYNIFTAGHAARSTQGLISAAVTPQAGQGYQGEPVMPSRNTGACVLCLNISPVVDQRDTRAVSEAVIPQAEQGDQGQPVMPTRDTRVCVTCLYISLLSLALWFAEFHCQPWLAVTLAYCPRGTASSQRAAGAGPEAALSATSCHAPLSLYPPSTSSSAFLRVLRCGSLRLATSRLDSLRC